MFSIRKKIVLIIATLLLLIGGATIVWYVWIFDPVYFRIITENEQGILSEEANRWLQNKDQEPGVHLYALEQKPYELLLHYSINNVNSYTTTNIKALWVRDTLRINISEELAGDDVLVDNELITYFILEKKPESIEVYINDVKKTIVPETDVFEISV